MQSYLVICIVETIIRRIILVNCLLDNKYNTILFLSTAGKQNMEEENKRETRRSRSKTPLTFRASVDGDIENDGEKKKLKKAPAVE